MDCACLVLDVVSARDVSLIRWYLFWLQVSALWRSRGDQGGVLRSPRRSSAERLAELVTWLLVQVVSGCNVMFWWFETPGDRRLGRPYLGSQVVGSVNQLAAVPGFGCPSCGNQGFLKLSMASFV